MKNKTSSLLSADMFSNWVFQAAIPWNNTITLKQPFSSYSWNTPLNSSIILTSSCFLENKMGIFQVIISTTLFNRSFMRFTFTFSCSCLSFLLAMTLIWLTGGKFKRAFESSPFFSPWRLADLWGPIVEEAFQEGVEIYIYIYSQSVIFAWIFS